MRYTISAGRYFSIPVRIHFTFPLILIAFGAEAWWHGTWQDALQAVALILAVFVCVVLHEFGHSLQVMRYGIVVRDIVLLPIGGLARAERLPDRPMQEVIVAISGPIVNFILAALLYALVRLRGAGFHPQTDFVASLVAINIMMGLFNLIPAFPMDGGRILRGLVATRMDYLRATHLARSVGQIIALGFVIVGFLDSAFIMLPLIAVFIFFAGGGEETIIRARTTLSDRTIGDLVDGNVEFLGVNDTVAQAVAYMTRTRLHALAVTDEAHVLTGLVRRRDLVAAVRTGHENDRLGGFIRYDFPVLRADMPALQAWFYVRAESQTLAGVTNDGYFRGIVHFDRVLESAS